MKWGVNMFIKRFFILAIVTAAMILGGCSSLSLEKHNDVDLGITFKEMDSYFDHSNNYNGINIRMGYFPLDDRVEKLTGFKSQVYSGILDNESEIESNNAKRFFIALKNSNTNDNYEESRIRSVLVMHKVADNLRQGINNDIFLKEVILKTAVNFYSDKESDDILRNLMQNLHNATEKLNGKEVRIQTGEFIAGRQNGNFRYRVYRDNENQYYIVSNINDDIDYNYEDIYNIFQGLLSSEPVDTLKTCFVFKESNDTPQEWVDKNRLLILQAVANGIDINSAIEWGDISNNKEKFLLRARKLAEVCIQKINNDKQSNEVTQKIQEELVDAFRNQIEASKNANRINWSDITALEEKYSIKLEKDLVLKALKLEENGMIFNN